MFVVGRRQLSSESWAFGSCVGWVVCLVSIEENCPGKVRRLVAAACWVGCLLLLGENCPGKAGCLLAALYWLVCLFSVGEKTVLGKPGVGSCCVLGRVFVVGRTKLS